MANFDVCRILVDIGSSVDIMYSQLFKTPQPNESHLTPYARSYFQGFNGTTNKPWGYVELLITFGEKEAVRQVKICFLAINYGSLYDCVLGRPTQAELTSVPFTVPLKMKYYTKRGRVIIVQGDIKFARRCFDATMNGLHLISTSKPRPVEKLMQDEQKPLPHVGSVDLDTCFTKGGVKN